LFVAAVNFFAPGAVSLTYQLFPYSSVLLEKLIFAQLVREIPHFLRNLKVYLYVHKTLLMVTVCLLLWE
jgi:hypothetical protein